VGEGKARSTADVAVPRRLGYQAALDGVRAFAILAVLAFHGGTRLTGGFIGVDVFFVLSGFLITTLLFQEWSDRGAVRLRGFYIRRARRLLPALFLTIGGVGLIYVADGALNHGISYPLQALAAISYVGNWVIVINPRPSPLGLLNHIWSLAVEEQFYILWPPILLVALRKHWSRERLAFLLLLAAAGSALLRATLWTVGVTQDLSVRSDTRADGLLLGCALAAAWGTPLLKRVNAATGSVTLAIAAAVVLVVLASGPMERGWFQFTVGFPIVAICAAIVINHVVANNGSLLTRTLALPPLVWIGARSYGMYLFHLPIMALITERRVHLGFWPTFFLRIAVIFAAAALSYRFLESRFLRKSRLPGAPAHVQRSQPDRDVAESLAAQQDLTPPGTQSPSSAPV
jgi:peptidoglycan/LPS O-acetylase OafA/YrhL